MTFHRKNWIRLGSAVVALAGLAAAGHMAIAGGRSGNDWPNVLFGTWHGTACGQPAIFTFHRGTMRTTHYGSYDYSYDSDAVISESKIIRNGRLRYDQYFIDSDPDEELFKGGNPSAKSRIVLGYDPGAKTISGDFYVWSRTCDVSLTKYSSGLDRDLTDRDDGDYMHVEDAFE
jgi:hypothetical protein